MAVTFRTKQIFCLIYCCVLFISGLIIICMTTVTSYKMFIHSNFVPSDNVGPLGILLTIGFLNLLLTWIAIKGPTREHTFYITTLVIFFSGIALILLGSFIWVIILTVNADKDVEKIMTDSFGGFLNYEYNKNDWNLLEDRYKCCGIFGPLDYTEKNCTKSTYGCKDVFVDDLRSLHLNILILVGIIFIQSVVGCFVYFTFRQALIEEREKRVRLKRERLLLARALRMSQGS